MKKLIAMLLALVMVFGLVACGNKAPDEAQASVRIMPICATMGEAAGVAAAVAKQTKTCVHNVDVAIVQKKLREKGAAID